MFSDITLLTDDNAIIIDTMILIIDVWCMNHEIQVFHMLVHIRDEITIFKYKMEKSEEHCLAYLYKNVM